MRRVTDPVATPLSLAEAKTYLRVDSSEDDALIIALIKSATTWAENHTQRAFLSQSWELRVSREDALCGVALPRPPAVSVTTVEYLNTAGAPIAHNDYTFYEFQDPASIVLESIPQDADPDRPDTVRVTYAAGYGDAPDDLPEDLRSAVYLLCSHLYENREAGFGQGSLKPGDHDMPVTVDRILNPYKIETI